MSRIETLVEEYKNWYRDYQKVREVLTFEKIDTVFDDATLKQYLKILQVLYERLRCLHYDMISVQDSQDVTSGGFKNLIDDYSKRASLHADTLQYQFLIPITLKLNEFSSRKSIIRDWAVFVLSVILSLIISWIFYYLSKG